MFDAFVSWPSAPLTRSLVLNAIKIIGQDIPISHILPDKWTGLLQWSAYDELDHELTNLHDQEIPVLASSYTFRKALIRKHFLAQIVRPYLAKNPDSCLMHVMPRTFELEISFVDELDELFADDLWELGEELENPTKWWILKPGMADRGNGIRLFNSRESLEQIFEEFEGNENSDEENENEAAEDTAVITSQLRHFVIQEYLSYPLLLDPSEAQLPTKTNPAPLERQGHKFHLRVYCVSSGALTLYLYDRILALFSAVPYAPPTSGTAHDLTPHLTNTSLQTHRGEDGVRLLDELIGCHIMSGSSQKRVFTAEDVAVIIEQIADGLAETFKAALATPVHFQALPNAFELFGVDFLVQHIPESDQFQASLLEVNAEPAIELTGPRLGWILEDLFKATAKVCVAPFFDRKEQKAEQWQVGERKDHFLKCLEVEVRR